MANRYIEVELTEEQLEVLRENIKASITYGESNLYFPDIETIANAPKVVTSSGRANIGGVLVVAKTPKGFVALAPQHQKMLGISVKAGKVPVDASKVDTQSHKIKAGW